MNKLDSMLKNKILEKYSNHTDTIKNKLFESISDSLKEMYNYRNYDIYGEPGSLRIKIRFDGYTLLAFQVQKNPKYWEIEVRKDDVPVTDMHKVLLPNGEEDVFKLANVIKTEFSEINPQDTEEDEETDYDEYDELDFNDIDLDSTIEDTLDMYSIAGVRG